MWTFSATDGKKSRARALEHTENGENMNENKIYMQPAAYSHMQCEINIFIADEVK